MVTGTGNPDLRLQTKEGQMVTGTGNPDLRLQNQWGTNGYRDRKSWPETPNQRKDNGPVTMDRRYSNWLVLQEMATATKRHGREICEPVVLSFNLTRQRRNQRWERTCGALWLEPHSPWRFIARTKIFFFSVVFFSHVYLHVRRSVHLHNYAYPNIPSAPPPPSPHPPDPQITCVPLPVAHKILFFKVQNIKTPDHPFTSLRSTSPTNAHSFD